MSGIKLILLSLVGALMMSAMAAGTAAASETRFFVEQAEVKGTEKVKVEGTSAVSKLESEFAGIKILIECKKGRSSGEIEKEGLSTGEMKFEECGHLFQRNGSHLKEELVACEVESPIVFKFKDKLMPGPGGVVEDEFEPETGEVLVKIKINGSTCLLKTVYEPKGKQVCSLPEGEYELVTHEKWCTSTGSKLKLAKGTEAPLVSFTSVEKVNTAGGKKWRG